MKTRRTLYYSVSFKPCGAEMHPAFKHARLDGARYVLDYPYLGVQGFMQGRLAQKGWAERSAQHLRSWGIEASDAKVIYHEKEKK